MTISTGASSSVSLNTVSLFKSALARKLPVKISSLISSDTEDEETSLADGALGGEIDDSLNRVNDSDKDKGNQKVVEGNSKDIRVSPRTVTSMNNEQYTMDSYVEQVKTNYISGDASVLMFGATASRQVNKKQYAHNTQ